MDSPTNTIHSSEDEAHNNPNEADTVNTNYLTPGYNTFQNNGDAGPGARKLSKLQNDGSIPGGRKLSTFHNEGAIHRDRTLTQVSDHAVLHVEETKLQIRSYVQCPDFFTKETLHQKLPITNWLPKYDISCAVSDAIAGITVGLTVIPQGIAYAGVAELPAQVLSIIPELPILDTSIIDIMLIGT